MLSSVFLLRPRWPISKLAEISSQTVNAKAIADANFRTEIPSYVSLLKACTDIYNGRIIHHHVLRNRLELTPPLSSLLVLMYIDCGAIDDAHSCILVLPRHQHTVFVWNFLFKACAQKELFPKAFQFYGDMIVHGVMPNKVTFLSMLDACGGQPTYSEVVQLHALTMDGGFDSDAVIGTSLLNLYAKVGSLHDAAKAFHRICEKDAVSWTSMISVHAQSGQKRMAFTLFQQMQREGAMPDKVTFVCAVTACDNPAALFDGRHIHSQILESRFDTDLVIGSALVNMYGKCDCITDAEKTFQQMSQRNVITWNSLIGVYSQHGLSSDAYLLSCRMRAEAMLPNRETYINMLTGCDNTEELKTYIGIHACLHGSGMDCDTTISNVLINMYGKCSALEHAGKVFYCMANLDVVSWTAIIAAYSQHGEFEEALYLFHKMQLVGTKPNEVTLVSLISSSTTLTKGRLLHFCVLEKHFESNDVINSALINMYVCFGSIEDAYLIFDHLSEQDAISWTAMIIGFAECGESRKALRFYVKMQQEGKQPNEVSFVNILCACAAQVSLNEGRLLHASIMETGADASVDVGNALINLYGKCGSIEDAYGLFSTMYKTDVVSWNTLLSVFSQHGHGKEAFETFHKMLSTENIPDKLTFASLLAACSHAGLINEALQLLMTANKIHSIMPSQDHFVCMVDLLGRIGCLMDAYYVIDFMPIQPAILSFIAFLGACQNHTQKELAESASKYLIEMDAENSASYVVMSNIYAKIYGSESSVYLNW